MAPLEPGSAITQRGETARQRIAQAKTGAQSASGGIWDWVNSILHGAGHIFGTLIGKYFPVLSFSLHNVLRELGVMKDVFAKLIAWLETGVLKQIQQRLVFVLQLAEAYTDVRVRRLRQLLAAAVNDLLAYVNLKVKDEAYHRSQADLRLDREIKTRIKWLHQAIEREAVSAYRGAQDARLGTIGRVGDLIINQNPIIRPLVRRVVAIVIDLAEVDNPVLRIAAGFLLRHIIDHLGIDRIAGHLLDDLVGSITGHKKPQGLAEVIADLAARCQASEDQWARFMANGGSDVEQAGAEWQSIAHYTTDALILAFFGAAVVTPHAWARDVSGTLGVVANDTIGKVAELFRKV